VFGSTDGTTFFDLRVHPLTNELADITIPTSQMIRAVLACRSSADRSRDHLDVDFVGLCP
jgi:hypothetical protein